MEPKTLTFMSGMIIVTQQESGYWKSKWAEGITPKLKKYTWGGNTPIQAVEGLCNHTPRGALTIAIVSYCRKEA